MRIVFLGTPVFAASILEHLVKTATRHSVVAVLSKPDSQSGRGRKVVQTPVHTMAEKLLPHVPILQPEKASDEKTVEFLRSLHADVFVVVAYGEIIKKAVLEVPKYGCLNIHASLLPHLRGAAPIQRALMQGDTTTGITIMRMDVGLDTGDTLLKKEVEISENMIFSELEHLLIEAAKSGIVEALDCIEDGNAHYIAQDTSQATYAHKIGEKDFCLHPEDHVRKLHNIIRACSPKPGAYFTLLVRGKPVRLKVLSSILQEKELDIPYPIFVEGEQRLSIANKTGVLLLKTVQLEGKAPLASEVFLRGYPLDCLSLIL